MCKIFVVLCVTAVVLSGCITAEMATRIADLERNVATAQGNVDKAKSENSTGLVDLQKKLDEAKVELSTVKDMALKERVSSGAGIGATVAENLSPIAAIFMPALGGLLAGIGASLRSIKDKFAS